MFKKYLNFFVFVLLTTLSLNNHFLTQKATAKNPLNLLSNSEQPLDQSFIQGKRQYQQTNFRASLQSFQSSYQNAQQQDNLEQQIKSLNFMAMSYLKLGQWQQAQKTISNSIDLINAQPQFNSHILFLLTQALNIQGNINFSIGEIESAIASWRKAQVQAESQNDFEAVQGSLINQVTGYSALGEYVKASKILTQLEARIEDLPNNQIKIYSLISLGNALQKQGNLKQSQQIFDKVLVSGRQILDEAEKAQVWLSLANTFKDLDETEQAINWYNRIINESKTKDLVVKAKLNKLAVLIAQQRWQEVKQDLPLISQEIQLLPASRSNIYAQINLVQSLLNLSALTQGDYRNQVIEILQKSLVQAEQLEDNHSLSYSYGMLGKLYLQQNRLSEAEKLTNKALVLAQRVNAIDIVVQWQSQLGSIYRLQGNQAQAITFYQSAVDNLESLSQDLYSNSQEIQFSFRESVEPIYRQLIDLLLADAQPQPENLQKSIAIFEQLHIAELKNFFGDGCLVSKSAEEINDQQAAIIYPIILPERLVVITSFPDGQFAYQSIDIEQEKLESTLTKVRNSLHPTASNRVRKQLTRQLHDWLIGNIETQLADKQISTLVFALDGVMRNLPMASLYDGENYLIEKYAIALIPVRVDLLDPQPWQTQRLDVLIGGLSESRKGFSSLPAVETEINQIASASPSKILLNQTFTENKLANLIEQTSFPVLHLATHGQFSSKQEETFLLTWDETINIKELETLIKSRKSDEAIELLILSACQTAIGDKRAALGLAGLAIRSGARSVVATLWSVNDESTAQLMANFYQQLQKEDMSKSQALRQAQLELLKSPKYEHPYYWTAFVMIGNWL